MSDLIKTWKAGMLAVDALTGEPKNRIPGGFEGWNCKKVAAHKTRKARRKANKQARKSRRVNR